MMLVCMLLASGYGHAEWGMGPQVHVKPRPPGSTGAEEPAGMCSGCQIQNTDYAGPL
jgi:hypothetical protein